MASNGFPLKVTLTKNKFDNENAIMAMMMVRMGIDGEDDDEDDDLS